MGIRDFCITMLAFCILVLTIGHCIQDVKIANLERQLKRIEYEYDAVLAENQKMERLSDATLQLIAEGGWR